MTHVDVAAKQRAFADQANAYDQLLKLKKHSMEDVYGQEAVHAAFDRSAKLTVGCMDERVKPDDGWKKIAVAGSCILLSPLELDTFVSHLNHAEATIDRVTYHEGCGACALFCKHCEKEGKAVADPEAEGKKGAKNLMQKLDLPGEPMRVGFRDMIGNPELHHARGIMLDCTGWFNPWKLPMPAMFELSVRYYPDEEQILEELGIAISIAFGDHGLGQKMFDVTQGGTPFAVALIEDPTNPGFSKELKKRVQRMLKEEYPNDTVFLHALGHHSGVKHAV